MPALAVGSPAYRNVSLQELAALQTAFVRRASGGAAATPLRPHLGRGRAIIFARVNNPRVFAGHLGGGGEPGRGVLRRLQCCHHTATLKVKARIEVTFGARSSPAVSGFISKCNEVNMIPKTLPGTYLIWTGNM